MTDPLVSIVIVNWEHPKIIENCLTTLFSNDPGLPYEVVVVDNGSKDPAVRQVLDSFMVDIKVVYNDENLYFAKGNNIGVAASDQRSPFILLLNSDVAFRDSEWLKKTVEWAEGQALVIPDIWNLDPVYPMQEPLDIVSVGWSYVPDLLPGQTKPEGWCCLIRRSWWRDLDERFPFHDGFDKAITDSIRAGAKCGVLWNFYPYMAHLEHGSEFELIEDKPQPTEQPQWLEWYKDLEIRTLDFNLDDVEREQLRGTSKLSASHCRGFIW